MSLRVFLVEDARNMQLVMAELFEQFAGSRVVGSATTEAEALLWLEEHAGDWDLAIVDLVLQQGSGIGVVSRAKATHPGGRVAVFSGYVSSGLSDHLVRLGADAAFDKSDTQSFLSWLYDRHCDSTGQCLAGPTGSR